MSSDMHNDIAVKVVGISKCYNIYDNSHDRLKQMVLPRLQRLFGREPKVYHREFWALKDVSFEVKKGATVGIIGRNGSGKSTLLQMICGTLNPSSGSIQTYGRVAALLELGSGFNPEFTGRENVYLNGSILGLSEREIDAFFDRIVTFADIGDAIEQPVKTYSSGMVVRLAFAVAAHVEPDILVVDEALAVGDLSFQARCLDRIKQLRDSGISTLFVTHDLGTFQALCDYGYLLDEGKVMSEGAPDHVAAQYYNLSQEHEMRRLRRIAGQAVVQTAGSVLETVAETPSIAEAKQSIAAKDADSEYRFGTHEALIVAHRLLDAGDRPCSTLRVGERFSVELEIDVRVALPDLTAAIMFRNAQGQNLFGANTRYDGPVSLAPSAGTRWLIRMEMEMLLNPGEYLLHIGLAQCQSDHAYVSLDNRDKVDVVTVHGKPVSFGLIHHKPRFQIIALSTNGPQETVAATITL